MKNQISWLEYLVLAAIIIVAALAFSPVLDAEFVNWDDPEYIMRNDNVLEFGDRDLLYSLKRIFSEPVDKIYTPIAVLTFGIEKWIWGLDQPHLWHIDNLIIHLLTVILCWLICLRLGLKKWSALFVAALFAVHPMHVESVMWVTERKDVLYSLFFFAGIFAYLRDQATSDSTRWKWFIWISFILSLFTKVVAVSFPVILILIDVIQGRRLSIKLFVEKLSYFICALAIGLLGVYLATTQGASPARDFDFNIFERLALAGYSLVIYMAKAFYPYEMIPIYLYPKYLGLHHYISLFAWMILILILAFIYYRIKDKIYFFGLSFFAAVVFFMLQILPVGQGFLADRFTYVAYFGLFVLFAKILETVAEKKSQNIYFCILPIIVLFSWMTHMQSKVWHNSETLWRHQIKCDPNTPTAWRNLSSYYKEKNKDEKYVNALTRAYQLDTTHTGILNQMGVLYGKQRSEKKRREGLKYFNQSIASDSSYAGVYVNRSRLLAKLNQPEASLNDLNKAIALDPALPSAYLNRSVLLYQFEEYEAALEDLNRYLQSNRNDPQRWAVKATILYKLSRYEQADMAIDQALAYDSENGLFFFEKAIITYQLGNRDKAKQLIDRSRSLGYNQRKEVEQQILLGAKIN